VIADIIVLATLGFAVAFTAAWILSPALRRWIERPKYTFQAHVTGYDEAERRRLDIKESSSDE
jgi:hypothetical protein